MVNPKRVLVVEDDRDIRASIVDLLQDEGYPVDFVENGLLALQFLQTAKVLPSLILIDISMPVMDGYTFRAEQVKIPRIASIPTAMISADGNVKDKAGRAGLAEYLRKPVEINELLALVAKYCRPGAG